MREVDIEFNVTFHLIKKKKKRRICALDIELAFFMNDAQHHTFPAYQ